MSNRFDFSVSQHSDRWTNKLLTVPNRRMMMIISLYRSTIYINKLYLCFTISTPTLTLSIHIVTYRWFRCLWIKTNHLYSRIPFMIQRHQEHSVYASIDWYNVTVSHTDLDPNPLRSPQHDVGRQWRFIFVGPCDVCAYTREITLASQRESYTNNTWWSRPGKETLKCRVWQSQLRHL